MSALLIVLVFALGTSFGFALYGILTSGHRRYRVPYVDIPSIDWIELTVSARRDKLWINGPNGLLLRAYRIDALALPEGVDR